MSTSISNGRPEDKEETARLQALSRQFAEARALQSAERTSKQIPARSTEANRTSI